MQNLHACSNSVCVMVMVLSKELLAFACIDVQIRVVRYLYFCIDPMRSTVVKKVPPSGTEYWDLLREIKM